MNQYKTIRQSAEGEIVINRSRFIYHIWPVATENDAVSYIDAMRTKHWNATHNVYAYALREQQIRRYSDDGEPKGTAGVPVLDILLKQELCDCCIVVTRYFGGVLLGAGGLVRAYGKSAGQAVEAAGIKLMRKCTSVTLKCDYTQYGKISSLIPAHMGKLTDTVFAEKVVLEGYLPVEQISGFEQQLADISCGAVTPVFGGDLFAESANE